MKTRRSRSSRSSSEESEEEQVEERHSTAALLCSSTRTTRSKSLRLITNAHPFCVALRRPRELSRV